MSPQRSKHDDACLTRRDQPGWRYLCSCAITDDELKHGNGKLFLRDVSPPPLIVDQRKGDRT